MATQVAEVSANRTHGDITRRQNEGSAYGDVANFYCSVLESQIRVEHEDNANAMRRIAGRNMAGCPQPYHHLPFFNSDLFNLRFEAIGILDAHLDIVEDWKQQFRRDVIYYLKGDRVCGVLLWNIRGQVAAARQLIESRKKVNPTSLAGHITDSSLRRSLLYWCAAS